MKNNKSTDQKFRELLLHASGFVLFTLAFCCFALWSAPKAFGVTPAPDGGYPNRTTAEGQNALFNLTTGTDNTALGFDALWNNTTGSFNTATGEQTLYINGVGSRNTAFGYRALYSNTFGSDNTASGYQALFNNLTVDPFQGGGSGNTAFGSQALSSNTTGGLNTANGWQALYRNTLGINNTANGSGALKANTAGANNTAIGYVALFANSTGTSNTALGAGAGVNVTTASNVICIGHSGANVNNSCFIGSIRGITTQNADAIPVVIDSAGQLGTISSSARFKKEITPMNKTSEAILALKPVTFHYKSDPAGAGPQFGLIAEEVEKVNPDLIVRDAQGKPYTVRYDAVNAMLLNEFLKEHRRVEEQESAVTQLKATATKQDATIAKQQKQIEALIAGLQKVSAQVELSRTVQQLAGND
jgi:hypothetical protein